MIERIFFVPLHYYALSDFLATKITAHFPFALVSVRESKKTGIFFKNDLQINYIFCSLKNV